MKYRFVTIEGCIGAGKTTLAQKLAGEFQATLILEQFEDNPFLPKFYEDPQRHAFPVELYFMAERFQQLKSLLSAGDLFSQFTVSDYLFQKSLIFATNNLQPDEARLYRMLFDIINPNLPKPDLTIYLYAPIDKLLHNIKKRGRSFEQQISADYLEHIQRAYLDFFKFQQDQSKVLLVDTTQLDFAERESDYAFLKSLLEQNYTNGITRV
ncbi:MAG: deoxynucleoside kinase [Chitinophagales bacterium]